MFSGLRSFYSELRRLALFPASLHRTRIAIPKPKAFVATKLATTKPIRTAKIFNTTLRYGIPQTQRLKQFLSLYGGAAIEPMLLVVCGHQLGGMLSHDSKSNQGVLGAVGLAFVMFRL